MGMTIKNLAKRISTGKINVQSYKDAVAANPNYGKRFTYSKSDDGDTTSRDSRVQQNDAMKELSDRYGIDLNTFDPADLDKWAADHNYKLVVNGMNSDYVPKYSGGFLGIGGKKLVSPQEEKDFEVLKQIAANNHRRNTAAKDHGAAVSAVLGLGDGITLGLVRPFANRQMKKDYEKAGLNPDEFVSGDQTIGKTVQSHSTANLVGNAAGEAILLHGLGGMVSNATKGIKWFGKVPKWAQGAINSGITFAIEGGAKTAANGGSAKDVIKNAAIEFVGGAAGSTVGSAVGSIGEKILSDKLVRHKLISGMIQNGFASSAFAGGKTASTYYLYPEEYRADKTAVAKDLAVAFAFGAIGSTIHTMKASKESKKYLDRLYQKMGADYKNIVMNNVSGKGDVSGIRKSAKQVLEYTRQMEAYLTGKSYEGTINGKTYRFTPDRARFIGQDKYVKSILEELGAIKNNANAVLNGISEPSKGVTVHKNTPEAVPVLGLALPGGGSTPGTAQGSSSISSSGIYPVSFRNNTQAGGNSLGTDTSAGIQTAASALEARGVIGSEQKAENAVKNSVRRIAKSAADIVGDKGDTAPLIKSSTELISDSGNLITPEYISDYARFFTQGLEAKGALAFRRLQGKTQDLTGELVRFATGKEVSEGIASDADFLALSKQFQDKLNGAMRVSQTLHNLIYGDNTALDAQITQYTSGDKGVVGNAVTPAQDIDYAVQTENSDVKFSIDEDFEANYDKWVEDGRPDRQVITVGKTSEPLKSIDVKDQIITWDTSKINKSFKKHRYLNDSIMKQIPDILENPIIVMQSKQSDSRITMFGEVYDGDGLPIMAVLELLPTNREGTVVLDEIKLASTYSKKSLNKPSDVSKTQNLINNSEILYLDPNKNRTDSWFTSNRLQLPLDITNYGPIKRITYPDGNVNSYSMQSGREYSDNNKGADKPLTLYDRNHIIDYRSPEADVILDRKQLTPDETNTLFSENLTPEIKEEARKIKEYAQKHDTSLIDTPERYEFRAQKADEYYNTFQADNKNREAVIIIGLPAAGKSTIAETICTGIGGMILDSDIIKEGDKKTGFQGIPEYNGGIGVSAVHGESTGIAEQVLSDYILPNGDNLVYPKVGGEPDGIVQIIESLKANGYSVSLVLNDLPVEKAINRTISRFEKTGRLVSPEKIIEYGYGPIETYNIIKERGICDGYEVYSNDVGFGEVPILCEKCRGRRTDKVDGRRREKVEGNRESGSGSEFRGTAENQRSTGEAETEGRAVGDTSAGIQAAASALEARGVIGSEQKAENAVKNSVRRIAKSAADIVGDKGDTAPLIKSSTELISDSGNLITPEYISDYARFFTQGLEAKGALAFRRLQGKTQDLTGELVRFATGKEVSEGLASDADFLALSKQFQDKLNGAMRVSQTLHNLIYGDNAALDAQITQYTSGDKGVVGNAVTPAQDIDYAVQTENPDVKFSIDKDFEANYDKWVEDGRPDRQVITVGKTSEPLKSIDVKDQMITWDTSKINKSFKKHRYLNDSIMKQIPDILENPIIVMQSKQSDSRITMFGEVYDGDGLPIMAVLELLPTNREGTVVLDEIKIVSAHSRKTGKSTSDMSQTQNLINNSEILYLDPNKNRTDSWFTSNRLQLPLDVTNYGPIKRITYPDGNVNSYSMQSGEKYSSKGAVNDGNDLLSGDVGRRDGESAGKQTESVAGRPEETTKASRARERSQADRRVYAENVRANGQVKTERVDNVQCDFIQEEAYNDEMRALAEENKKFGIKTTRFFVGQGRRAFSNVPFRGVIINGDTVFICYDHETYTPEQINRHELCHKNYNTSVVQKIKNIIKNSLSISEKHKIINELYKKYHEVYNGNEEKIFEEFVCDVLSGMSQYTAQFEQLAKEYWSSNEAAESAYDAGTYAQSIDAGGATDSNFSADSTYPSWVYETLDGGELRKLESSLMDIRIGNKGRFVRAHSGEYIVQTHNKLIYTNGDYDNPEISKVIAFNDNYETNIDDARRMIYGAEKRGEARYRSTLQAIEDSYGKGFLYIRTDSTNAGFAGSRKGKNSGENTQNRSKKSQRRERDKRIIEAARRGISFDDDGSRP